jgi:hypothetical protein
MTVHLYGALARERHEELLREAECRRSMAINGNGRRPKLSLFSKRKEQREVCNDQC